MYYLTISLSISSEIWEMRILFLKQCFSKGGPETPWIRITPRCKFLSFPAAPPNQNLVTGDRVQVCIATAPPRDLSELSSLKADEQEPPWQSSG